MAVRRNWLVFTIFILLFSLFLVACERPLPSDQSMPAAPTAAAVVEDEGYPGVTEGLESMAAEEEVAYPGGEVELPLIAEGPDAYPVDGYPGEEIAGETAEAEAEEEPVEEAESETAETEAEDEAAEEAEGESAETEAEEEAVEEAEGETAEDEAEEVAAEESESESAEAEAEEEEPVEEAEGEMAETEAEEETAEEVESETAEAETEEEAVEEAEGETAEVEAEEEAQGGVPESDTEEEIVEDEVERQVHIVAQGQNLFSIGLQYGMSWVSLAQFNGITNPDAISPGQELIIPTLADLEAQVAAASTPSEEVAEEVSEEAEAEEAGEEVVEETEVEESEASEEPQDEDAAESHDEDVDETHDDDTDEAVEDSAGEASEEAEEDEEAAAEPDAEEAAEDEAAADTEMTPYIVQLGDTLYRIAVQFGVTVSEIAEANGLTNINQIYFGQELQIPGQKAGTGSGEAAGSLSHEVQEGETIFGVSFAYGIAWTELVQANEMEPPYALEPGTVLIIPSGE